MLRLKRGVSEIIASLVVLLIISILGTSIYSFSLSVMQSQNDNLHSSMTVEGERIQERMKLLSVVWNGMDDILNISLLNYGEIDLKLADVYVNGLQVETYHSGQFQEISNLEVDTISFTSPISLSPDNLYQIVIVSNRGVSYIKSWES
jgi:hypothetical protein